MREFSSARTAVYIDAGNPRWHSPREMAARLLRANIAEATGFALNVANSIGLEENVAYGHRLAQLLPGKHFVIDTGRNGSGPLLRADGAVEWCNPPGRSLGRPPTLETMLEYVDALLWVKPPGSSDGECNDGPPAGTWWPDYALDLARPTK